MRVLIVEDEPLLADTVREGLERAGMMADVVHDGDLALTRLSLNEYDIVVLDRDIPGTTGDDVCRELTSTRAPVRVMMLTASARTDQMVSGFALGADDYLAKPFALAELVVRLRALGRRSAAQRPPIFEHLGVRLDPFRHEVSRDGVILHLPRKEFAVLEILLAADGAIVSTNALRAGAWDAHAESMTNSIRVTISTLRKHLGQPWIIETIPGSGYRVVEGGEREPN